MNAGLTSIGSHSRGAIVAKLAAALRSSHSNATNIESTLAATGVTSQEVAANFGSNRELMLAMVAELSEAMSAPLNDSAQPAELRQRLLEFARCVSDIYTRSHLRSLYRIAITESIRHTGLGRDFYDAGPGRLTQRVAAFLQAAQTDGSLRSIDSHLLASHFLAALRAHLDITDTFSHASGAVDDRPCVQEVVDLFLDGIIGAKQPC